MLATKFSPNAVTVPKLPSLVKSAPTFVTTTEMFASLMRPSGYLCKCRHKISTTLSARDVASVAQRKQKKSQHFPGQRAPSAGGSAKPGAGCLALAGHPVCSPHEASNHIANSCHLLTTWQTV